MWIPHGSSQLSKDKEGSFQELRFGSKETHSYWSIVDWKTKDSIFEINPKKGPCCGIERMKQGNQKEKRLILQDFCSATKKKYSLKNTKQKFFLLLSFNTQLEYIFLFTRFKKKKKGFHSNKW